MKVMMTLSISKKGGPYVSHSRIMESQLNKKHSFIPFYVPRLRKIWTKKFLISARDFIQTSKPDLIQISGLQLEGFSQLLIYKCINRKIPIVLAVRGSSQEAQNIGRVWKLLIGLLELWTLKHADIVYGVSNYVSGWEIIKKSKCNYYGCIYNIPRTQGKVVLNREKARKKYGFDNDDIIIISTGRITAEKGYDVLQAVIDKTVNIPHIRYLIVGDGNYLNLMKEANKSNHNVCFTGQVSNVDNYLAISDIFIICTKHETLCNSVIEAGMYGLPVIANNVGGIPEIIDNDRGILIENNSVIEYCKKINELINEPKLRVQYGTSLQKHIETVFSEKYNMDKLDEVYRNAIELSNKN